MRMIAHLAVLVVFATLLASCGGDETKTTPVTQPGQPRAADQCETAWTKYVETSKVGTSTKYLVNTTTDTAGNVPVVTKSERKETVTEATPEQVTSEHVTKSLQPAAPETKTTVTVKRAEFIQGCQAPSAAPEGFKMEVLEEKDASVTVPAGTFASRYRKTKLTGTAGSHESITEMWTATDETKRLVKMVTESTIKQDTDEIKTTSTTELAELTVP